MFEKALSNGTPPIPVDVITRDKTNEQIGFERLIEYMKKSNEGVNKISSFFSILQTYKSFHFQTKKKKKVGTFTKAQHDGTFIEQWKGELAKETFTFENILKPMTELLAVKLSREQVINHSFNFVLS